MRNIVVFLYNLSMYEYTVKKTAAYLSDDYQITLFHISALSREYGSTDWKQDSDVELCDIGGWSFRRIYRELHDRRPHCVVFYTYQSIFDLILIKVCELQGIPTVYHDHGIVYGKTTKAVTRRQVHSRNMARAIEYSSKIGALLIKSRGRALGTARELYKVLIQNDFRELRFTKYFFFCKHNLRQYRGMLDVEEGSYVVAGVPFFTDASQEHSLRKTIRQNIAIYMHQPFLRIGYSDISFDEELEFLREIGRILGWHGYHLEVRLHPIDEYEKYASLNTLGVVVKKDEDLPTECSRAKMIIGHWSTAMLMGAIFEIPIVAMPFPGMKEDRFVGLFGTISTWCSDLSRLDGFLHETKNRVVSERDRREVADMIGDGNTFESNARRLGTLLYSIK